MWTSLGELPARLDHPVQGLPVRRGGLVGARGLAGAAPALDPDHAAAAADLAEDLPPAVGHPANGKAFLVDHPHGLREVYAGLAGWERVPSLGLRLRDLVAEL